MENSNITENNSELQINENEIKQEETLPKDLKSMPNKMVKKKDKKNKGQIKNLIKKRKQIRWAIIILFLTFFLSGLFSFMSEFLIGKSGIAVSFIILFTLIFISIIADIIGVAAASCSVEPFLAMASRKIKGAKRAVSLVKNAEKVTSICCDVIGDICGIISGAAVSAIILKLFAGPFVADANTIVQVIVTILLSSLVAALTVGGKALGKKIAIDNSQSIVFFVAKILSVFSRR